MININVNLNRDCGLLITDGGIFRKIRLAEFQKQVINIGDDYETIRTDLEPADFIEDGIHFLFKDGSEKSTEQYRELATFLYGENYNESTFLLPNSLDYSIMGDLDDDIGVYSPKQGIPDHFHDISHTDIFDHVHEGLTGVVVTTHNEGAPHVLVNLIDSSNTSLTSEFKGDSEVTGNGELEFSRLNVLKFIIAKIEE